jgi:hypothetical protein
MVLTFGDYLLVTACISVAAFASYSAHVVAQAIRGYLDDI